jgi:hypothetical protein
VPFANANVDGRANAIVSAIVVSFMGRVLQSPPFVKIRHNRTRAIKSFFSAMGVAKLFTSHRAVQCSLHIEKNPPG